MYTTYVKIYAGIKYMSHSTASKMIVSSLASLSISILYFFPHFNNIAFQLIKIN